MDISVAANNLRKLVEASNLPEFQDEYGKDHLIYMIDKLVSGEIVAEKSHRWLGWIQGCICVGNGGSLETMKRINKEA